MRSKGHLAQCGKSTELLHEGWDEMRLQLQQGPDHKGTHRGLDLGLKEMGAPDRLIPFSLSQIDSSLYDPQL